MKVGACPTLILVLAAGALSCTAQSREQAPYTQGAAPRGEAGGAPAALAPVTVEGQPLSANIQRVVEALDSLGAPLPADLRTDLTKAGRARDATSCRNCSMPGCCLWCTSIRRRA